MIEPRRIMSPAHRYTPSLTHTLPPSLSLSLCLSVCHSHPLGHSLSMLCLYLYVTLFLFVSLCSVSTPLSLSLFICFITLLNIYSGGYVLSCDDVGVDVFYIEMPRWFLKPHTLYRLSILIMATTKKKRISKAYSTRS